MTGKKVIEVDVTTGHRREYVEPVRDPFEVKGGPSEEQLAQHEYSAKSDGLAFKFLAKLAELHPEIVEGQKWLLKRAELKARRKKKPKK